MATGASIERYRLRSIATGGGALLLLLACVKVAVHLLTATGYGYFVDELYYLAMQPHLGRQREAAGHRHFDGSVDSTGKVHSRS